MLAEAELAGARFGPATAHAERAITVLRKQPSGVLELGRARLVLAKLRWRDPATRAEARQLAQAAAQDLATQPHDSGLLRDARLWLATH